MIEICRFRNKNSSPELFRQYRRIVRKLTENVKHLLPGIENRGFDTYHIDHIISIKIGYMKGIDPSAIANISNLRIIPKDENLKKGAYGKPIQIQPNNISK